MADGVTLYRIFIASPSHLDRERQACRETIEEYNRTEAIQHHMLFFPVGWEHVPSGSGNPQSKILDSLEKCDYFILMLWDHWGTRPGGRERSSSGSEAEYKAAVRCLMADPSEKPMRDMAVFFKAVAPKQMADPGKDLKEVLAFKTRLEAQHKLLYANFDSVEGSQGLRQHLRGQLAAWKEAHLTGNLEKAQSSQRVRPRLDESLKPTAPRRASSNPEVKKAERLARERQEVEADKAFARAIAGNDPEALYSYGQYLLSSGLATEARAQFRKLLKITVAGSHWKACAYSGLGTVHKLRGQYREAESMFRKALALEQRARHRGCVADQYANLGIILKRLEELDEAERMQRRALKIYERLGEREGQAIVYGNLGVIFRKRGNQHEAERLLWESVKLGRKSRSLLALTRAYGNLGVIYRIRGELDRAKEMFQRSLRLNERLGSLVGEATQYGYLGRVYTQLEDFRRAEHMLQRSLQMNEILGSRNGLAKQHTSFGDLYAAQGDWVNARKSWIRAAELFRELELPKKVQELQGRLAREHTPLAVVDPGS
jgi:tetratricopeptide (TPR) repeat protein